jgi:murein L,D-transpeptidase YafK
MVFLWVGLLLMGGFEGEQRRHDRVDAAFDNQAETVEAEFRAAGAAWPPAGLYLRAFKEEGALELWAKPRKGDARVLVRTFAICAKSGGLGPKVREGDGQVPEGFYTINRFNPNSRYHLSLGLDYPNAVDKARAGEDPPGGDIFIHGKCVTIGCLPLEDGPVEALYVAAVRARDRGQTKIPVHVFPCRFGTETCKAAMADASHELIAFWLELQAGWMFFETTKLPPQVTATSKGYRFR